MTNKESFPEDEAIDYAIEVFNDGAPFVYHRPFLSQAPRHYEPFTAELALLNVLGPIELDAASLREVRWMTQETENRIENYQLIMAMRRAKADALNSIISIDPIVDSEQ